MAVLFLIVFVIILTLSAFWPNSGREEALDVAVNRGSVPAGQMLAYHAAATRACHAIGPSCTAGASIVPLGNIQQQMSGLMVPGDKAFTDGRFGAFSTGQFVVTYYNAREVAPRSAAEQRQSALSWLYTQLSPDTLANVGVWDAPYFRARTYRASTTAPDGTVGSGESLYGTVLLTPPVAIPAGAPMIRTRTM